MTKRESGQQAGKGMQMGLLNEAGGRMLRPWPDCWGLGSSFCFFSAHSYPEHGWGPQAAFSLHNHCVFLPHLV